MQPMLDEGSFVSAKVAGQPPQLILPGGQSADSLPRQGKLHRLEPRFGGDDATRGGGRAGRRRLEALGVSESEIGRLEQSGAASRTMPILAPGGLRSMSSVSNAVDVQNVRPVMQCCPAQLPSAFCAPQSVVCIFAILLAGTLLVARALIVERRS